MLSSKHGFSWSHTHFLYVRVWDETSKTVRLVPLKRRRLGQFVPFPRYSNLWWASGTLNSYCSLAEFCFPSIAKLPVLCTNEV